MPETWLKAAFELQGWLYAGALAALGQLRAANWRDLPGTRATAIAAWSGWGRCRAIGRCGDFVTSSARARRKLKPMWLV